MADVAAAKRLVLSYFSDLEKSAATDARRILKRYVADSGYRLRAVHPFNEIDGSDLAAETVWQPLFSAFTALQRRQDIFMAAPNELDGTLWVTSMGKFMGLADRDWLGIRPTGRLAMIPYCEFHRIDDGKIAESALWIDIVSVMKQAGYTPLPGQTGADIVNPGPRTQDGLLFDPQDAGESQKTLDLILRMCDDLTSTEEFASSNEQLAETWHDSMLWFGPGGIGATRTIERYQQQHQGPFSRGLDDIDFRGHVLEHAEGCYGAWFGWPNMTMRLGGGFLGMPASDRLTEMRVVDVYRREGELLAENWIFIDFLHFFELLGVDILERTTSMAPRYPAN